MVEITYQETDVIDFNFIISIKIEMTNNTKILVYYTFIKISLHLFKKKIKGMNKRSPEVIYIFCNNLTQIL